AGHGQAQHLAEDCADNQQGEHAADQVSGLFVKSRFHRLCKSTTAERARSRKACFDSAASNRSGVPKLMLLNSGTARNSPLGKMRLRLSTSTGTNSTSGRRLAR